MIWNKKYEIGIPVIDAQHKRLFAMVEELTDALQKGIRGKDITKMLAALDQYKTRHFQLEEKHMQESNYPGLAEQQRAHQYFNRRFAQFKDQLSEKGLGPEIVREMKQELQDWLTDHVTGLDLEFGEYHRKWLQQ